MAYALRSGIVCLCVQGAPKCPTHLSLRFSCGPPVNNILHMLHTYGVAAFMHADACILYIHLRLHTVAPQHIVECIQQHTRTSYASQSSTQRNKQPAAQYPGWRQCDRVIVDYRCSTAAFTLGVCGVRSVRTPHFIPYMLCVAQTTRAVY